MALIVKDRVKETTTTTGTGTITLAGSPTGFRTFADIGNGNTTYYCISGGSQFEVGIGTYTASGTTLSRDTVLSNSLGTTALINFSAGTKDVFVTYPSDKALLGTTSAVASTGTGSVVLSDNPTLVTPVLGTPTSATLTNATGLPIVAGTTGTLSVTRGGTGVTTSTGTGSVVLSASPTLTGTLSAPIVNTTGDITVKAGSTTGSATITTPTTELVFSQTGDTFGTSSLRLQNRNNANGAIFETVGLGLVDFIFKVDASNQRNIRYETRGGVNEFQIGLPSGNYTLGVADTFAKITKTTASTSTTTGALQVAGGIGVAGQINGLNFGKGAGALTGNHVVGENALASASLSGLANTAFGSNTLRDNTTGADNTGVGFFALRYNTTGGNNTALGQGTLQTNTTGSSNVAVGRSALQNNTNSSNTALGTYAFANNVGGSENIGIGVQTGNFIADGVTTLTTPTQSIYIGNFIRGNTVSETNAIAIGYNARSLGSNTTVIGNSSTTQTKVFGAIQSTTYTVATLPSASTVGVGARAFVTDALSPVFGMPLGTGTGAVPVPVYSTGSAWNVG